MPTATRFYHHRITVCANFRGNPRNGSAIYFWRLRAVGSKKKAQAVLTNLKNVRKEQEEDEEEVEEQVEGIRRQGCSCSCSREYDNARE